MIETERRVADLPEGRLPIDVERPDGVVVHSLTAHALHAIERHKWIESERAGRDLGMSAVEDWLQRFWTGWARARLIEHLYGWRCWGAFDEDDYGLLHRSSVEHHVPADILAHVAEILATGGENLDVINWALSRGHPLDGVLWLLDRIDINAKRHRLLTQHIRLFLQRVAP